ncbi:uncharacterized protein LOC6558380 [Drosophila grimshawi]|uniref:GH15730 n=1 Tax=Drosophila grimshawi TaxID=7222 RepID=B4IYL7_DROGR|nr:uncharacterized protein LOC6558380 [Drosophila grimshawi]EDV95527.1 GH15730 [Drosophila grimshawi]
MTDYELYLEAAWQWLSYLPHVLIIYVLLTLLPKSLRRIKRFADADFEANRLRFHRCYGPDLCCHAHKEELDKEAPLKQKQRKPVTRVYPKRQQPEANSAPCHNSTTPIKISSSSNVTKIARMFEAGGNAGGKRQVSRVAPELRMFGGASNDGSTESTPCASRKSSIATQLTAQLQHIEHAMQLWQELEEEQQQQQQQQSKLNDWKPVPTIRQPCNGGTSATPSTASPLCSSPELTSPVQLRQPPALCLNSSIEDIFQAIARSAEEPGDINWRHLAPVTCIDDILSERRFSRPLSAYSITDLLKEEQETLCLNETKLQLPLATS